MTIADLAGPVLLRVLPTTIAILLVTALLASLPVLLPRFAAWLRGPAPVRPPEPQPQRSEDESGVTYSI